MLCQNQRRRGYYHDVPSESSDGLVGLARACSSLDFLLPQLVNQLLHVEGIQGQNSHADRMLSTIAA